MKRTWNRMVVASRNAGKIAELQRILHADFPDVCLLSLDDIGFSGEIDENGTTFEENALIKARTVRSSSPADAAVFGDDSGLSVDALNGAPGVYSARYAGEHGNDEANNRKLVADLASVPLPERTARFVCCMACILPDGREMVVRGESGTGLILNEPHGNGGFGYDPYFFLPDVRKTFSELTADEKDAVSHRGRAALALADCLRKTEA